ASQEFGGSICVEPGCVSQSWRQLQSLVASEAGWQAWESAGDRRAGHRANRQRAAAPASRAQRRRILFARPLPPIFRARTANARRRAQHSLARRAGAGIEKRGGRQVASDRAGKGRAVIVSHTHKYIFIKSLKTAGTSIEAALSQHCSENDMVTP